MKGPSAVQVRFSNNGGKAYARAEAHLVYSVPNSDDTKVTYSWIDDKGVQRASHVFGAAKTESAPWQVMTGRDTQTHWVEFGVVKRR